MKIFKPTSIIFLIVSAVLIVAGVALCVVGYAMAGKQDVSLFYESAGKDGNSVINKTFSGKSIKKVTLDLDKCDVYIIGDSDKSGVELINFTESEFEYTITNNELTVKNAGIFSAFHINESGSNFSGLRHYLAIPFYSGKAKTVKVYIPKDETDISGYNISVENGKISVENVNSNSNYSINLGNGDVSVKNTKSSGTCDINIENGTLFFNLNDILGTKVHINQKGGIICDVNSQNSFTCECEKGVVYLDSNNIGGKYQGTYPTKSKNEKSDKKDENKKESKDEKVVENKDSSVKIPNTFFAKVKDGNIKIRYSES